jgi:hypothetical protein
VFILHEHSARPMRLRGNKIIPATIIPLFKECLECKEYVGLQSGIKARVLNVGGHLNPAPECKDAYYLSNVMPATLDEAASNAGNGEIFVPVNSTYKVELFTVYEVETVNWPASLNGFWISVSFNQDNLMCGYGWFCKNEERSQAIVVNGELKNTKTTIKALRSLFQKSVECIGQNVVQAATYSLSED